MKELYLAGAVVLSGVAVYSTITAVKYKYSAQDLPSNEFVPADRESTPAFEPEEIQSDVLYNQNPFDINRGASEEDLAEDVEEVKEVLGSYTFELRGIIGVGKSPVAMFSAKLNGRSSSSRGRTSTRTTVAASSDKIYNCKVGDSIGDSTYEIKSIEGGSVLIQDSKGNNQTFNFSLSSEESVKRSESAFKTEQARQKTFSKQNTFTQPKKPVTGNKPPPKPTSPEEAAKKREAEMRARAEKLKEEMKRLKELREEKSKEEAKKKDKKKN